MAGKIQGTLAERGKTKHAGAGRTDDLCGESEVTMELGAGITAGSAILGSAAVAIKIINAIVVTRKGNGNGNGTHCEKAHCSDHEGIVVKVDGIEKWLTRIDNKIDRLLERRADDRN